MEHTLRFSFQETETLTLNHLQISAQEKSLMQQTKVLCDALKDGYQTEYASLSLVFDTVMHHAVEQVVIEKKKLNPTVLVVIGIGGSALGAKAVHQAIRGRFYHANNPALRVYFVQTIDSDRIATIVQVLEQELQKGRNVLINVVTKSGTTTETMVNFEVILQVLKTYRPMNYARFVIVTTDKDSPLWVRAQHEQFECLEIPKKVGGRYSVFSAVGLFPLAIAGIDCALLLAGARSIIESLQDSLVTNIAALSALLLYEHYKTGITINDMFIFSVDLEAVGKWYRQLMGESIGKEWNNHGQQVLTGITPTVSLGTIDLHSVAQLYLAGPRDKFTTFVTVESGHQKIIVPPTMSSLKNKTLSELMQAFVQGTQVAYKKNDRPFCTVTLPEKNEFFLGQFLQYKMLEIMYLGYLLEVNPFDQPNVELYKKEVRAILHHKKSC